MPLDLRVWPVRTAPISEDGPRIAFQIRRPAGHRAPRRVGPRRRTGRRCGSASASPGTTATNPCPGGAQGAVARARLLRRPRPVPQAARRRTPTAVARGRVPVAGQTRLTSLPRSDTVPISEDPAHLAAAFISRRDGAPCRVPSQKIAAAAAVTLVAGLGLTGSRGQCRRSHRRVLRGPVGAREHRPVEPGTRRRPTTRSTRWPARCGPSRSWPTTPTPTGTGCTWRTPRRHAGARSACSATAPCEFLAAGEPDGNYVSTFTYGVTDGDRYRTGDGHRERPGPQADAADARAAAGPQEAQPEGEAARGRLVHQPEPKVRMLLLAGNPKKENASVQRFVYPGRTFTFSTKERRWPTSRCWSRRTATTISIVNEGRLNTRNGHLSAADTLRGRRSSRQG